MYYLFVPISLQRAHARMVSVIMVYLVMAIASQTLVMLALLDKTVIWN